MGDDDDQVLAFLAIMGINGHIVISTTLERMIAIPTEQFKQRRVWIGRFFRLVEQHEDYCYFRERMRE